MARRVVLGLMAILVVLTLAGCATTPPSPADVLKKELGHKPENGLLLHLLRGSLEPQRARRGDTLTVTLRYALFGAPPKGTEVRVSLSLGFRGTTLAQVYDDRFTRLEGIWEDTFKIQVPPKAKRGSYNLDIRLRALDKDGGEPQTRQLQLPFDVRG